MVKPWVGGLGQWPVLGTIVAYAGQMPVPLVVLALAAALGVVRRATDPLALVAGVMLGLWGVLVWLGLPLPGQLDGVALLAPGTALLAAVLLLDLLRELWSRETSSSRTGGVVLGLLIAAALAADLRVGGEDRRNTLARVPGVLTLTTGIRPAVLHPEDLGLLVDAPRSTSILPGHRGGEALANSLKRMQPALANVVFGAAFSCDRVLVRMGPDMGVETLWTTLGHQEACSASGRTCLYAVRTPARAAKPTN